VFILILCTVTQVLYVSVHTVQDQSIHSATRSICTHCTMSIW